MVVYKEKILNARLAGEIRRSQVGTSMLEVLLSFVVIAMAMPFVYNKIVDSNNKIQDLALVNKITNIHDSALNFVRENQSDWPDAAQIRLSESELDYISGVPIMGFVDKYMSYDTTMTDVYLVFDIHQNAFRTTMIAQMIGSDAAVVGENGTVYGGTWAITAPDLRPGNLVYRVSMDFSSENKAKFLHRGTFGDDGLNVMARDLDMNGNNFYNVGGVGAESLKFQDMSVMFLNAKNISGDTAYFLSGANMDGQDASVGSMRVSGDVSGFKSIVAGTLNDKRYTTNTKIITDRATVNTNIKRHNDKPI